jgi:peptide/nickel transport system substrate-binding protein
MTLLISLFACGSPPPPAPEESAPPAAVISNVPVDGANLVVAVPFDLGNVNPLVTPYALSGMVVDLVNPGLVRRQVGEEGLTYEPALAESWTWSEDGTELTYRLRSELTWADGKPLTADDVVFTHELIADPAVASNWLGNAKFIVSVEAIDARTVKFKFDGPRNPVLQQGYTIRGILPKHVLGDADRSTLRGHPSARDPLASGPFDITEWAPNERIVLERNPNAPLAWRSHLDRIVLKVLPEYGTRLLELQNGDVDMMMDVEPDDVTALETSGRVEVLVEPAESMEYIGYLLSDPRFSDLRVRKALTMGIDRDRLVQQLLSVGSEVRGQPCVGTISPALGPWYASDLKPFPYDVAAAKALLDEAGWKDPDGDGVRGKDGQDLRFQLMIQAGVSRAEKTSVLVQAAWKDIGVAVEIDKVEPTRFADRARNKQYEALLWGFGANPKVDPSMEWRSDGQYNWTGYANAEVDALIDRGVSATDVEEAQAAFRDVQKLVHADQPVTFLFWADGFLAIDKRFRNAHFDTYTKLLHAEQWWVPEAEQKYRTR